MVSQASQEMYSDQLSWQVTPAGIDEIFGDDDPERAKRAMAAMLKMKKFDIAALREAADGVAAG